MKTAEDEKLEKLLRVTLTLKRVLGYLKDKAEDISRENQYLIKQIEEVKNKIKEGL